MQGSHSFDSLTLEERVVLLTLAEATKEGADPVASLDVKPRAESVCDRTDADIMGSLGDADVMRALSVLGSKPFVAEKQSSTSPVGKGRPKYTLDTDPEQVFEVFSDDDHLEPVVSALSD